RVTDTAGSQWDCDLPGPNDGQTGTASPYLTGSASRSGCRPQINGSVGNAPAAVFETYRYARLQSGSTQTLSYSFPVTPGREYTINLYFAEPTYDRYNQRREFDVQVDGVVPTQFRDIQLYDRYEPTWRSATVTAADNSLDLVWIRD